MSDTAHDQAIETLAGWLHEASHGLAFTGAGISTESGIPDFRSPGGVWSRHQPVMYQDFLRDADERRRYWQIRRESVPDFIAAQPNAGHRALAELERHGHLVAVITQNIDELHQRAGSRRVLEVHGTAMRARCLSCDKRWTCEEMVPWLADADFETPVCDACGGIVKSMTVSFGEELPGEVWMESMQLCRDCDLFLAMGSSLLVYPAAQLPETAKARGARLVIINRDATPMDGIADLVIHGSIGETFEAVMRIFDEGPT
ncbi:MAG: NAD-dependent deacetylase [Phycisphaerae bacterium]